MGIVMLRRSRGNKIPSRSFQTEALPPLSFLAGDFFSVNISACPLRLQAPDPGGGVGGGSICRKVFPQARDLFDAKEKKSLFLELKQQCAQMSLLQSRVFVINSVFRQFHRSNSAKPVANSKQRFEIIFSVVGGRSSGAHQEGTVNSTRLAKQAFFKLLLYVYDFFFS